MKVRIDSSACEGYGMCANHLPEVFKLDELGYAYVEQDGAVPEGMESLARRAIVECPASAIHED